MRERGDAHGLEQVLNTGQDDEAVLAFRLQSFAFGDDHALE
jgi:hypothetical protein